MESPWNCETARAGSGRQAAETRKWLKAGGIHFTLGWWPSASGLPVPPTVHGAWWTQASCSLGGGLSRGVRSPARKGLPEPRTRVFGKVAQYQGTSDSICEKDQVGRALGSATGSLLPRWCGWALLELKGNPTLRSRSPSPRGLRRRRGFTLGTRYRSKFLDSVLSSWASRAEAQRPAFQRFEVTGSQVYMRKRANLAGPFIPPARDGACPERIPLSRPHLPLTPRSGAAAVEPKGRPGHLPC